MKEHDIRQFLGFLTAALALSCYSPAIRAADRTDLSKESLGAAFGEAKTASVPVTGPDLVLWLDAQDIEGRGDRHEPASPR